MQGGGAQERGFHMQNRYIAPRLTLYSAVEDALMLSSELPPRPGGNSGTIELPPIQMRADEYAPPAISLEDAPTDILMGSNDGDNSGGDASDLLGAGVWGSDTNIEFPPKPMD